MRLFQAGHAFEARVNGDVLSVPLVDERPAPRWLGTEVPLFGHLRRTFRVVARMNLAKLAAVSFDYNDQHGWFDLKDTRGQSLRLLLTVGTLSENEALVLAYLRQQVKTRQLQVDRETAVALSSGSPAG